ncbi:hypothetical protein RHS01_09782 [Rhizoctonia solani]|uniref:Uncharacterized protein n=1 Tax=Rhizoctonia solani TaxID=456999 RepID=A0A8H7I4S7_9AGAM|nr:hypothetical protein RHS01_09782 [Rhizoctonia solani]
MSGQRRVEQRLPLILNDDIDSNSEESRPPSVQRPHSAPEATSHTRCGHTYYLPRWRTAEFPPPSEATLPSWPPPPNRRTWTYLVTPPDSIGKYEQYTIFLPSAERLEKQGAFGAPVAGLDHDARNRPRGPPHSAWLPAPPTFGVSGSHILGARPWASPRQFALDVPAYIGRSRKQEA